MYSALHHAVMENSLDLLRDLLAKGTNPNVSNDYEETPLHLAARKNAKECMELLLSAEGIDVNTPNVSGNTPLYLAAWYGSKDCLELLLKHKDIEVDMNNYAHTPLYASIRKRNMDCAYLLIDYGANYEDIENYNFGSSIENHDYDELIEEIKEYIQTAILVKEPSQ